jgi:hypothetical protein
MEDNKIVHCACRPGTFCDSPIRVSGLFPESSDFANQMAPATSLSDVVVLCNLQLPKDGVGICQGDIRLDNTTNIAMVFVKGSAGYNRVVRHRFYN